MRAWWAALAALFSLASPAACASPPPVAALRVVSTVNASLHPLPAAAVPPQLSDIADLSGGVVVAVGRQCAGLPEVCRGVVVRTVDGGSVWHDVVETQGALTHVAALGPNFTWAWGSDTAVVSTDGGLRWKAISAPSGNLIFVSFATPRSGWAAAGGLAGGGCASMGCFTVLYQTSDGGGRWAPVATDGPLGEPAALASAHVPATLPWAEYLGGGDLGGGRGWLLADGAVGLVYLSRDGGRHWFDGKTLNGGGAPVVAAFGRHGAAWGATVGCSPSRCGNVSVMYATTDGGATWKRWGTITPTIVALAPSADGGSVWALTSVTPAPACGWNSICGGGVDAIAPGAAPSSVRVRSAGRVTIEALAPRDVSDAWAIASGVHAVQSIVHTVDGGRTWQVQYRVAHGAVPDGAWGFWNAADGWAIGTSSDPDAILRTDDGGRTWRRSGRAPDGPFQNAGFVSPAFGWALAADGRLIITRDGGAVWHTAQPFAPGCSEVVSAGFRGAAWGWALTSGGATTCPYGSLFVTSDGGAHWTEAMVPQGAQSLAFNGPRDGWAVVLPPTPEAAVLEATTQTGDSWTVLGNAGGRDQSNALWQQPLLVDGAGALWLGNLRSTDGGRKWTRFALPSAATATVAGVMGPPPTLAFGGFVNARIGWLQAQGGLYRTQDGGRSWMEVSPVGD